MSLVGKRQAIADVLTALDGVTGYAYRPASARPGDAWPQWGGSEIDEPSGQMFETWRVFVQLPADDVAAEKWTDAHRDLLWEALESEGYVSAFDPVDIGQDQRPRVPALQITMRSE